MPDNKLLEGSILLLLVEVLLGLVDIPFGVVYKKYEAYRYSPFPQKFQKIKWSPLVPSLLCSEMHFIYISKYLRDIYALS